MSHPSTDPPPPAADPLLAAAPPRARPVTPGPSAPPTPEAPPADPRRRPTSRRSVLVAVVVAAVLLGTVAWFGVRALLGTPVALEVDGQPIVNAEQLLDDLTPRLVGIAAEDGAPLPEDAGCWFAPPAERTGAVRSLPGQGPRIACGPVRLGIAGDDQLWLVAQPSYSTGDEVRGQVAELDEVAEVDRSTLNRPDGERPPADRPDIGTDGVRAEDGRLITNSAAYLAAADPDFAEAARGAGASVAPSTRCYLGVLEVTRAGQPIRQSTGSAWCGPVRTANAEPGATWAAVSLSLTTSQSLVAAVAADPSLNQVGESEALPPGERLWRPDGQQPDPNAEKDLPPPAAEPQRAGFSDVVADLAAPVKLSTPTDGRLNTPALSLTLTGLFRGQVGTGDKAVVAAPGEELVVARYQAQPVESVGGASTATLVVDGVRTPFPAWSKVAEGGWLLASVPAAARAVDLEVLFDDRAQTISLLTGDRAAGAPAALYRKTSTVGVGRSARVSVALPKGDPAVVSVVVVDASLTAWTSEDRWARSGQAYLRIGLGQLQADRPCCDLRVEELTPTFTLRVPGQPPVTADPPGPGDPAVVFVVPETLTEATLAVNADVVYDGGRATGKATSVPLRLPA